MLSDKSPRTSSPTASNLSRHRFPRERRRVQPRRRAVVVGVARPLRAALRAPRAFGGGGDVLLRVASSRTYQWPCSSTPTPPMRSRGAFPTTTKCLPRASQCLTMMTTTTKLRGRGRKLVILQKRQQQQQQKKKMKKSGGSSSGGSGGSGCAAAARGRRTVAGVARDVEGVYGAGASQLLAPPELVARLATDYPRRRCTGRRGI